MLPLIEIRSTPVSYNELVVVSKYEDPNRNSNHKITRLEDVVMKDDPINFSAMTKEIVSSFDTFLRRTHTNCMSMSVNSSQDGQEMCVDVIANIQRMQDDPSPLLKRDIIGACELQWMKRNVQDGAKPRSCRVFLSATGSQIQRRLLFLNKKCQKRMRSGRKTTPHRTEQSPKRRRVNQRIKWVNLKTHDKLMKLIENRILLCCTGFLDFGVTMSKNLVQEELRESVKDLSLYIPLLMKAFPGYRNYNRLVFLTEKEMTQFVISYVQKNHADDEIGEWMINVTKKGVTRKLDDNIVLKYLDTLCSEVGLIFFDTLKKLHEGPETSRVLELHGLSIIDNRVSHYPSQDAVSEDVFEGA